MVFQCNELQWLLVLCFIGKGGEFLVDVYVWIVDGKGVEVLKIDMCGLYMFVKVLLGCYMVYVLYQGSDELCVVMVGVKGGVKVVFQWSVQQFVVCGWVFGCVIG